jgi:hypothetical protein
MPKFFKNNYMQLVALCPVVFLAAFLVCSPAIVFATSPSPVESVRSASVTIQGKINDAVIAGERHFIVTASTIILDANGNKIALSELPIPCNGEIEYQLRMDEEPICLRIILSNR